MNARLRDGARPRDGAALALAALLAFAGVAHFVAPGGFDAIVPDLLPGPARFWTYLSGAIEIVLGIGVAVPVTRRAAATITAVFFVLVFPANVNMAIAWASHPAPEFAVALLRLPLQIPLIWWTWHVRNRAVTKADSKGPPQDVPLPELDL